MLENVTATPFLGLFLILVCWIIGVKLQKKTGWLVCNPVLTSSCMIVLILMATGIPLDHFRTGGSLISMLLGPATAVLALTIYRQKAILHEHFLPILIGCAFGSLVSIAAAVALCHLFGTNSIFSASMLPKSVTTAIALGISESGGGIPGITAAAVVITGIEGAVLAPFLAKHFKITDPVAEGVAIGACSHAIGTMKALEIGKIQGAMSSHLTLCLRDCYDGAGGCVYVNMESAPKLGRFFKMTCLHCSTSYFKVAMEACRFVRRFVTDWGIAYAWGLPFLPMCRHFQRPAYQSGSFLQFSVHMGPSTLSLAHPTS